jgi:hypothetical protein
MIYGSHRAKSAPVLGALPGQDGPFGHWPDPAEEDDAVTIDAPDDPAAVTVPVHGGRK